MAGLAAPSGPGRAEPAALTVDVNKLLAAPPEASERQRAESHELNVALDNAVEPLDRAVAHLAIANWHLAVPPARPATRWVLGLHEPADAKMISASAEKALEHLAEAGKLLKDQPAEAARGSERTRLRRLSTHLKTLRAFADLFAAAGSRAGEKTAPESWSQMALALSEARESENVQVASAAILWQAMAWEQAGRRERALATLPEALAKPDSSFDFLSRLLRCRLLSDAGQHGAALALAVRIAADTRDWFPQEDKPDLAARNRLVGLLQLKIGQGWAAALKLGTRPSDAELLGGVLEAVRKDLSADGRNSAEVYVLERAVPILVPRPAVAEPGRNPSDTRSAPGEPPTSAPGERDESPEEK
ncbi:MAG: hypothetical protein HRF43_18610 [Phycisphaerae bacterium]